LIQLQEFNTVDGECQAENVIGDPVFLDDIPHADYQCKDKAQDCFIVEKGLENQNVGFGGGALDEREVKVVLLVVAAGRPNLVYK
jgi:hypothetical protein